MRPETLAKGPYEVFGIQIDSEWDSSIKWNRLADHIGPLTGKRLLDMCMDVLYHRRSPLDTRLQIHGMMVPGGQLVLETLVLEGDGQVALFPQKRYAKMNNIFFIPTVACLTGQGRRRHALAARR